MKPDGGRPTRRRPRRICWQAKRCSPFTHVDAPARRLYDRWGWQKIGKFETSGFDLLMLDLR